MTIYSQQTSQNNGVTGNVTVAVGDSDTGGGGPERVNVLIYVEDSNFTFQPQGSTSTPPYQHVAGPGNTVQWMEVEVKLEPVFVDIVYAFAVPTGAPSTKAWVQVFSSRTGHAVTAPHSVSIVVQSPPPMALLSEPQWRARFEHIEKLLDTIIKRLDSCD